MTTNTKKERIPEFDMFKGVAIVLVVCGHILSRNWENVIDNHPVYTWIYSFHMPLFFFISGYLIDYTAGSRSICYGLKKKALSLLVPYFIWCFAIAPFINGAKLPSVIYVTTNADYRYWFIYLLFLFSCIYYVGKLVFNKRYCCGGIIIAIAIFGVGQLLYPCDIFSRGLQFVLIYFFGVWASKTNLNEKAEIFKEPLLSLVLFAFIISSISYCHHDIEYLNKACKLISSFSICYIALYYINNHSINMNNKVVKMISFIGNNSIVIYLTHFFFLQITSIAFMPKISLNPFWSFFISLAISIVIIAVCLLLGKIVERFKWFNRLVYGRGW